ncbi:MAG: SDR family NAD(P)-dependent oxidoreductase [Alphaproteobacteria bacterium]
MRLDGRVAVVTGAGAGLGRAYALALARHGAHVAVQDIDAAGAEETRALIQTRGGEARAFACDVADVAALARCLHGVESTAGRIDVLVNNAGATEGPPTIEGVGEADFDRMFAVNVKGTFFATRAVVPGMKRRRAGKIINVSSINAMIGDAIDSHYTGAKAAILGLTKAWAKELAPWGICVNAVAPGHVITRATLGRGWARIREVSETRIPMGRYAEPREIAPAVVFLASPQSDFITGQVLSPNGGEAIVGF